MLETPIGNIPVYNNVREGLDAGHRFNCGVVYLPPVGRRDGVVELIRVNPELKKIFIPTEKMSVHDAREIRALAQQSGIDIFGGNSLGVADSWNQVRIGGALGGDARATRCARARSRSCPTPAASPPPSRSTCAWPAGARRR